MGDFYRLQPKAGLRHDEIERVPYDEAMKARAMAAGDLEASLPATD